MLVQPVYECAHGGCVCRTRDKRLAADDGAGRHQAPERGAPVAEVQNLGRQAPLAVVQFGCGKEHVLVNGNLGFWSAEHDVAGLAVDTDGGQRGGVAAQGETAEDVVETLGLAGVLGKPDYRDRAALGHILHQPHSYYLVFRLWRSRSWGSRASWSPRSRRATPSRCLASFSRAALQSGHWHSSLYSSGVV